jgi:hypothetical protein
LLRLRRTLLVTAVLGWSLTAGLGVAAAEAHGGLDNRTVSVGSTYMITGQTGTLGHGRVRATGGVTLSGRSSSGQARVLARTTTAADGRFRLTIHLVTRGKLDLRLATPDRHVAHFTLTVV